MVTRVKLPDGRTAEFPDEMSHDQIAAVLREQFPPQQERTVAPPENLGEALAGSAETTLRGIGRGFFGVGDRLAAAGNVAGVTAGNAIRRAAGAEPVDAPSFGEALEEERQRTDELAELFPETNIAGQLTGAVAGVPKAVAAGAARIPKVGDAFAKALTITKGQTARNVARTAGSGAVAGAVTEANLGGDAEDIGQAAVTSAIAAPAVGAAVRLAGGTANVVRGALDKIDNAGFDALAKGLSSKAVKINPSELRRRAGEFFKRTGRGATLAEILEPGGAQELRAATGQGFRGQRATEVLEDFAENRRIGLQDTLAEGVERGRVVTGAEEVAARNKEISDRAFGKIARKPVSLSATEIREFTSGPIGRVLAQESPFAFRALRTAIEEGDEIGRITVRDADDIRQALNAASTKATGSGRSRFKAASDRITEITFDEVPEFADALAGAKRRGRFRTGVEEGRGVTSASETAFRQTVARSDAPTRAGLRTGARTAIRDAARASPDSARRTAAELAESRGTGANLSQLDPGEAARLQGLAQEELRALNSIKETVRGSKVGDALEEELNDVQSALELGTLTTGRFSGGFLVNTLLRSFRRIGIPPTAAENLAKAATDPSRTDDVINALERAGVEPNVGHRLARATSRASARIIGPSSNQEELRS